MSRFAGRGLDQAWFLFFVMHVPISLLLDVQPLYPSWVLARTPFPAFLKWYLTFSRDPILGNAFSGNPDWEWMRIFIKMEGFFQVPCFIVGAVGLWRNDKRVYPLLLAYAASATTAVIPTLFALVQTKVVPALTSYELAILLGSYVPFLLIPFGITVDMGTRLLRIVNEAQSRKSM